MVKLIPTLANLGFLLQISGFFTLLPIGYAFYINESNAAIGLLITAIVFLCLGFILNALCERKTLNLRQSFALLILFYVVVTLINTIPYLYLNIFQGNILEQFLNSWFETMSASSTSGLTLMQGMTVPHSLMLARGLSEWIGGMGIVFILLSTFYPSEKLDEYSKALGFERLSRTYKGTFFIVLIIYLTYTLIFSAFLMITGLDAFTAFHTVLTVFSTTGLTIISASSMPLPSVIVIVLMMLASAFSFVFHFKLLTFIAKIEWKQLFRRKWHIFLESIKSLEWKSLLSFELKLYLVLLAFLTIALWLFSGINPLQSFYHIADFSSSCGLGVVNFEEIGEAGKIILIITMFIGPMSFSIGGGIRVIRAYILGKTLVTLPKTLLKRKIPKIKIEGQKFELQGTSIHLLIIVLFTLLSLGGAWILSNYGYSFTDATIESVSALTTTGDSPKVLTPALPIIPKLLLIMLHLLGRIEIIPIFMLFMREKPPERKPYQII